MATYYHSSSSQRDAIPTLYLRDPAPESYPEPPVLPGNMMMYLNYPSSAGSYSDTLAVNPQPQQNGVEIPPVGASESTTRQQGILSNLTSSHIGEPNYTVWRDGRNEMLFMQPTGVTASMQQIGGQLSSTVDNLGQSSVTEDLQMDMRSQLGILHGGQNLQGQGLSLSLSTQIPSAIPVPSFQYRDPNSGLLSFLSSHPSFSGEGGSRTSSSRGEERSQSKQPKNLEYLTPGFPGGNHESVKGEALNNVQSHMGHKPMHSDTSSYGLPNFASTVPHSKYLKAAQQLLDEVVNVRKALKQPESEKHQSLQGFGLKGSKQADEGLKCSSMLPTTEMPSNPESTTNSSTEISPTERQDLQNKLTKLLSMLDEVDRRYKQYYQQMQIVVSSFDVIAGSGAAKPYTALALQTISRHFRCLRDAISGQIQATRRSLGEQDTSASSKGGGISRLRYVDQQLRQQRALQQLGMMQHHAWRPQRGLPENSVSILRAWLFEHFLHPYPKDSEKIMLARQTGLTRSQVSNWFINARVRLWKPMVEEMYKEETGDPEMDSNSSSENAHKAATDDIRDSQEKDTDLPRSETPASTERCQAAQLHDSKSEFISDIEMAGSSSGAGFQDGVTVDDPDYGIMKLRGGQRSSTDDCSLFQEALVQSDGSGTGRFMAAATAYQMSELGRFGSGNGVSLTLGLQHCDNGGLTISNGTHHNFITMRGDEMYDAAASSVGPQTADYDCVNPGSRQHRFTTSRLLHDFVA